METEEDDPTCLLEDDEYATMCELAQFGQINQLKDFLKKTLVNRRVSVSTFNSNPSASNVVRRPSPIVLATRFGHLKVVQYFLQNFSSAVVLNPGNTSNLMDSRSLRHNLPLYWASLNGHLDVVKLLVSAGALVNLPNCTMATPLHAAATNGHLRVVEYLLHKGADINTSDIYNSSPLFAAIHNGHLKVVKLLLKQGAGTSQEMIDGSTVMHVAARRGQYEIVKILLAHSVSPAFREADPNNSENNLVPCPIFLAAYNGCIAIVLELLSHPHCSPAIKSDALMLLGVGHWMRSDTNRSGQYKLGSCDLTDYADCWKMALMVREDNKVVPKYPIPLPEYGRRTEVRSFKELLMVINNTSEATYHSLLVLERCYGYSNKTLIKAMLAPGRLELLYLPLECREAIRKRRLDMLLQAWRSELARSSYPPEPSVVQRTLEMLLNRLCNICFPDIFTVGVVLDIHQYIRFGLEALEILQELQERLRCEADSLQGVLGCILFYFAVWLHFCNKSNTNGREAENVIRGKLSYQCPTVCDDLGQRFVSKHLFSPEGTTLLHLVFSDHRITRSTRQTYWPTQVQLDLVPSVHFLLRWGADAALGVANSNGQWPLHLAVKMANTTKLDVIKPLVLRGAHLDYVNREGKTPLRLCCWEEKRYLLEPVGPSRLVCLACHVIIKEDLPYLSLNIPPPVKRVIQYHDSRLRFRKR